MTTLSIYSRNHQPNLSIRLRPGQSCTIGSSSAADHLVSGPEIAPIHCRISCQNFGGFIECLNPKDRIEINNKLKNRSRLVHGDQLQVGQVEFEIEVPNIEVASTSEFKIDFSSEETPSTVEGPGTFVDLEDGEDETAGFAPPLIDPADLKEDKDLDSFDNEPLASDDFPAATPIDVASGTSDNLADSNMEEPLSAADPTIQASKNRTDSSPEANPSPNPKPDSDEEKMALAKPVAPSNPPAQFVFDSADTAELSQVDLDLINQLDEASENDLLNQSLNFSSPEESSEADAEIDETSALPRSAGVESAPEDAFTGAINAGKYWKWTDANAASMLRDLVSQNPGLTFLRSQGINLTRETTDTITSEWLRDQEHCVFLLTHVSKEGFAHAAKINSWDNRVGYPQAATMFLALSPTRVLVEFFELVDSIIIIENGNIELCRKESVM